MRTILILLTVLLASCEKDKCYHCTNGQASVIYCEDVYYNPYNTMDEQIEYMRNNGFDCDRYR